MADTRTITIHIAPEIDDELTDFAESIGRDKASIARDLLLEWLEDQEDIRDVQARIAEGNDTISLEELKKRLDLEA
jgi:predicted DNA-binding protein